jgi:hypothetical protein
MREGSTGILNDDICSYLERSVLCWLATIAEDGTPNVSPKEIFVPEADRFVLIAHVASPVSVRNIRSNPSVCLSFVEVFEQRGFKLNGLARVIEPHEAEFAARVAPLERIATPRFPIRALIAVEVLKVARIQAPRYGLYADTTPEAQVARSVKTYNRVLEQHGQKLGG